MKFKSFVLATLLITLGISAAAQQRGPRGGLRGQGLGVDPVAQIRDALKLTPEQSDKLRVLLDGRLQAEQAGQDNIQSKIDALAMVQEKSPKNATAIAAASQDLRQAQDSRREAGDRFRADFIALLTPEQKMTFDGIIAIAPALGALNQLGVIDNPPGPGGNGRGAFPVPPLPPPGVPANPPRGGRGPGRGAVQPPAGNPITAEKVALGKRLFSDKNLSADGTTSCASCHDPEKAFSDTRRVSTGVHKTPGLRNSPALIQAAFSRAFFWDGRTPTLERQVIQPILNPNELGLTEGELERKTGIKTDEIRDALASYVRTIRSTDSRFDRFQRGDGSALTEFEKAGFEVFRGRGGCAGCHAGPNLTDDQFHNTGVAWSGGKFADEGRYAVTLDERDHGAFKTPTLREIARTAPYMHDGSQATLEDVVAFYGQGGHRNPYLDPRVRPLGLSTGEQKAIVAFLKTLSGQVRDGL